ncbi:MAG: hypothetical protein ACXVB1_15870, partial [Pseudobdellovibrionaceae bacterium]
MENKTYNLVHRFGSRKSRTDLVFFNINSGATLTLIRVRIKVSTLAIFKKHIDVFSLSLAFLNQIH